MEEYVNCTYYVCPRCADIWADKEECPFCGCTMIKTKYTASDYIPYIESQKGDQFKNKIRNEYVYGNPLYSDTEYQRRLEAEERKFYSSPVLNCPRCGSTAVGTGQSGLFGGFRTFHRCGSCGYKWTP